MPPTSDAMSKNWNPVEGQGEAEDTSTKLVFIGHELPRADILSALEMAALVDEIKSLNAPAIFLDTADNDILAKQIADETGVMIVADLHLESLTDGAPEPTYIDMMKDNVSKIVEALK